MAELTLYHIAPSRSSLVLWLLEEIGEPYELRVFDPKKGENREPEFLAINPMGKVPALRHGDVVITEAAAICCYLADAFPKAGLNVPIGDKRRGPYLKWLFFGPSCLEPSLIDRMHQRATPLPRAQVGWGDADSPIEAVAQGLKPGPYLLGEQFTVADMVIGGGLRFAMMVKAIPERPDFRAYVARITDRPAQKRAAEKDQQLAAAQG